MEFTHRPTGVRIPRVSVSHLGQAVLASVAWDLGLQLRSGVIGSPQSREVSHLPAYYS
jgi:hypothetical protein